KALIRFTQTLTRLRHKYPILRRNRFLTGEYNQELEVKDLTWVNVNVAEMDDSQWSDSSMRCFGMLIDGRAQTTGVRQRGKEATILLVVNGHHERVRFKLQPCRAASSWPLLVATNLTEDQGPTMV